MTNTNSTQTAKTAELATLAASASAAILKAGGTPEAAAAAAEAILAPFFGNEAPKAPEAPKAQTPKAPKAPKGKKAPKLDPESWTSYRTADGPHMGKAKNLPADAIDVETHATQGKALQALNAMRKADQDAAQAPKAEAPKAEAKPEAAPRRDDDAPADPDRKARIDKKNAAIIAQIPYGKNGAMRRKVQAKLDQLEKAGYPYARLQRNKKHQLDGLHVYPGEKGHGRDAAFTACVTKQGAAQRAKCDAWAAKRDAAQVDGQAAPKRPKPLQGVFVWSPVGGGNLYARGVFGPVSES